MVNKLFLKYFICIFIVIFVSNIVACVNYGPISLKSERSKYNLAIQKTNDEQLLLNLVRLKYRDTPFFMEVSNVASQFRLKNKASFTAQLQSLIEDIFSLGASTSFEESPTVSYSPLQGDKFVKNILSTLPLKTIVLLFHSGWSVERIFRISFQLLNDLENAPGASGPTPKIAPQYKEFLKAISLLQELDNQDALSINYQEYNEQPQLILKIADDQKQSKVFLEFARITNINPEKPTYILSHFPSSSQVGHIKIIPRSFLGIMFYLSQSIEIPSLDVTKGKITVTKTVEGGIFDWADVTGDLLSIRSSEHKPNKAKTRIYYRNMWFYIDDTDLESKSTFSLLSQIYSLQSGAIKKTAPVLTIGIGS